VSILLQLHGWLERRWPTKEKKGLQTAFYYKDPDHNIVELNVNNYDDEWTARREASLTPDCSISLYRSPPLKPSGIHLETNRSTSGLMSK
jgi:hypothetical protein